jgi:zinc finger protein 830
MADVRALLKAKRQEARITHPLASYNQNGQLRCLACGTLVKHTSAWQGHLGSKIHRTNVARLKDEERARETQRLREEEEHQEQVARGKRKAEPQDSESESDEGDTKRRKVGEAKSHSADFPNDFFSDSSRAPLPPQSDDSGDEDDTAKPPATPAGPQTAIDLEYERFQREMLNGPDHHETYERATVFAEAELADETHEGMPAQDGNDVQTDLTQKISEEAARQQKEQDERELIMDRLLDEEREQEEADMKVSVMKTRMEALRKRREAKASKPNPAS